MDGLWRGRGCWAQGLTPSGLGLNPAQPSPNVWAAWVSLAASLSFKGVCPVYSLLSRPHIPQHCRPSVPQTPRGHLNLLSQEEEGSCRVSLSLSLCLSQPWHFFSIPPPDSPLSIPLLPLFSPLSLPPPPLLCRVYFQNLRILPKPLTFTLWNQKIFYFSLPELGWWKRFPQGSYLPFWR